MRNIDIGVLRHKTPLTWPQERNPYRAEYQEFAARDPLYGKSLEIITFLDCLGPIQPGSFEDVERAIEQQANLSREKLECAYLVTHGSMGGDHYRRVTYSYFSPNGTFVEYTPSFIEFMIGSHDGMLLTRDIVEHYRKIFMAKFLQKLGKIQVREPSTLVDVFPFRYTVRRTDESINLWIRPYFISYPDRICIGADSDHRRYEEKHLHLTYPSCMGESRVGINERGFITQEGRMLKDRFKTQDERERELEALGWDKNAPLGVLAAPLTEEDDTVFEQLLDMITESFRTYETTILVGHSR